MKLAYIILAHQLPDQLVRLVRKLNADEVSFFIHVDKKTDKNTYNRMVDPLRAYPNVRFIERIRCNWGDYGIVRATLACMQEIIASGIQFEYTIMLSGQSYPIKSNRHIQEVMRQSGGKSFLTYTNDPHAEKWAYAEKWEQRMTHWHLNWLRWHFEFPRLDMFGNPGLNRLWNVLARRIHLRRKLPEGLKPFYGSAWWCLSRECIIYLDNFARHNKDFMKFFSKYVHIPDEIIFQTILLNSPLKDGIVKDDLVYIDFSKHGAHPEILEKNDFDRFMITGNLFARKFDMTIDGEVLDMIDAVIL